MKKASRAADAAQLQQIPNIGPAMVRDFAKLGIEKPGDLKSRDPYVLYDELCRITGVRQDPCVLDTFISAVKFMNGAPPKPWWAYTTERKRKMGG